MGIINIALNNLKLLTKDKMAAVFIIVLPIMFTLIIGSSNNVSSSDPIPVAILDEDNGIYSQYIIDAIEEDSEFYLTFVNLERGKEMVRNAEVAAFIHIPKGFEERVEAGENTKIMFYPSNRQISPLMVEKLVDKRVLELNNSSRISRSIISVFNLDTAYGLKDEIIKGFRSVPVEIDFTWSNPDTNGTLIPTGMNQSSPGIAVMFTLMTVVMSGASTILIERDNGTLARLLTTPITKGKIVFGKTLGVFLVGITQMLILIIFGQVVLGVKWGNDMVATILLTLAFVFSATGLAMSLASISKNANQLGVVGNIIIIVLSMLGGAYWPVDMLSPKMQLVAKFVPTGWAINGYNDLIARGMSLGDVWLNILVLFLFGLAFILFGIKRLKLE